MRVKYRVKQNIYIHDGKLYRPGMIVRINKTHYATIKYVPGMPQMRKYYNPHDRTPENFYEYENHIIAVTGGDYTTRNNGYGWNVSTDEVEIVED